MLAKLLEVAAARARNKGNSATADVLVEPIGRSYRLDDILPLEER